MCPLVISVENYTLTTSGFFFLGFVGDEEERFEAILTSGDWGL